MINNSFLKKTMCLLFSLFIFFILELSARFFFRKDCELEKIVSILNRDPVIFWRQRSNLDVLFHGVKIHTDAWGLRNQKLNLKKKENSLRIICLGPSSTFGWGVENEKTYPYLLEKIIKSEHADFQDIEVINAGVIGYSSYQGKVFIKKNILQFKPDIIIVSYLINDIDKYRFYRSNGKADKDLGEENKLSVWLENIFERSKLYRALKKVLLYGRKNFGYDGDKRGIYFERRRVSENDYSVNLNEIINIAEASDIKVVFLNTPVGVDHNVREGVDKLQRDKAAKSIDSALACGSLKLYDSAIKELNKALEYNPYSAKALFYLGFYHFKKKDTNSAKVYLQKAKEMELLECVRISKIYNDIMSRVAHERNIPLVNAVSAFEEFTQKTGLSLFINPAQDFVHPNIEGHRIISQEIYKILLKFKLFVARKTS